MKKPLALIALLLTLMLSCSALAETAVPVATKIYPDLYFLSTIGEADAVEIQHNSKVGLMALDGTFIIEPQYGHIRLADSNYPGLYIVANENGDNTLSLIDRSNQMLTKALYGDIDIISEDWFIGVVLKKTNSSDFDYHGTGDTKYRVSKYDVYYRPTGELVGSLKRDQYARAAAFGEYLLVENDKGNVQLYDKNFKKVSSTFESSFDSEFTANNKMEVVSNITGEKIASGYRAVIADVFDEYFYVATYENLLYTYLDRNGNVLLTPDNYTSGKKYLTDTAVYVELKLNNKVGLYDLRTQALVVPCEYDKLIDINFGAAIAVNGYICVEKDGKLGYIRNGEVTCPVEYSKGDMTVLGCSMFSKDQNGIYTLVAADGHIATLEDVTEISTFGKTNASGKYFAVKNAAGLWGLMDWHGHLVFDYSVTYASFDFVDATHFIVDKAIYEIK